MNLNLRAKDIVSALMVATLLSGCASLPSSGPTRSQIYKSSGSGDRNVGFKIIEINSFDALPVNKERDIPPLTPGLPQPSNIIGPNDVLGISVYEAGIALFTAAADGSGASAANSAVIRSEVDDDGFINFPYVGRIKAAGHTTTEVGQTIESMMRGRSEAPQVIVNFQRSITNSVMLSGEVATSGRLPLSTNRETILDALALAGGYRGDPSDLIVKIERDGQSTEIRLDDLQRSQAGEMRVFPGDNITVLRDPESFSVLGAAGNTTQIPFNRRSVSLAEALSRAGGVDENAGDPAAIFVFRFVRREDGAEEPIVYHLNMLKGETLFLAQKFIMQDRDVLFVANAAANQPRKMVQTLSQLFTPILTVRTITRTR